MASFRKRGKFYQYRVSYVDSSGVKQTIYKSGFRTKALAVSAATEMENSIRQGANPQQSEVTLLDYWDEWLATYKSGDKSPNTEYRYGLLRSHLARKFEGRELQSVKPMEWQAFLNDFAAGTDLTKPHERSKDIVSKLNGYTRSMVKSAINEQILHTDFTFGAHIRGVDASDKVKVLDQPNFQAVKVAAHDGINMNHVGYLAVYIACMTGLRVSEVCALTWDDIDTKHRLVHVTRSWDDLRDCFKPTKTASSVRDVEVSNDFISTLGTFHTLQSAADLRTGYRDPEGMILRSRYHKVITKTSCNKALRAIEDSCGISKDIQITFHGLRHSHVSYLISQGVDIYYISKRLGHKDIAITMKVYGHLLDSKRSIEAAKAVRLLDAL